MYERMIAGLSSVDPLTGLAGALAGLTTREKNDPSIAFLDAWAVCGDVLTFYQERLANEGYLRTATERRSVLELGRLVGYTLQPGVSASAYAAYVIDDNATTIIPAGAKMQSAPMLPDEQPQVFETAETIEARGEWNLLAPRMTKLQEVTEPKLLDARFRLYIEGSEHNLSSGDALLFEFAGEAQAYVVAWIRDVDADRVANRTSVSFHRVTRGTRLDPTNNGSPAPDAEIISIPPSAFVTPDVQITQESILEDPSVPPASQFEMAASYDDRFKGTSDFRIRAIGELVPQFKALPALLANAPRRTDARLTGLWVLRNKAAIFGYNAPAQIPTLVSLAKNTTFNPPATDAQTEAANRLYLEQPDEAIDNGSWVVLLKGAKVLVRRVSDAISMPRAVYGISGKTTRLDLDVKWWLAANFDEIRTTTVLARSEALTLAWEPITDPVGAHKEAAAGSKANETKIVIVKEKLIALERIAAGLTAGRWIIVSGERADLPGVMSAELAMIAEVRQTGLHAESGEVFSILVLAGEGLSYSYKRDTVKIYGNVVKITHGETRSDILGNGDATQRLQPFTLRHAPLTWVAAANPKGVVTTLQVRVHDVLWHETGSLAGAGAADRVYVTKTADDGKTTITFGTGEAGARLPTGTDNVRAVYRSGIGRAGNVRAGQINIAMTRPVGVRDVINPIAASGGADPEARDQARRNVPLAVRALGRVVSVRDYEEFARTFAGIAKARATVPAKRRDTILLTIAGDGEMEVLETSDLYRALVEALRKYGNPLQPLRVVNREKVLMTGSARVQVYRDYEWRSVAPKIRASLLDTFSFEHRELLQPIFQSEVVAAIQCVEGVDWVDLDTLSGVDTAQLINTETLPPKLEAIIPPRATFENGKWRGDGLAYLPASLADAFLIQEVPHA